MLSCRACVTCARSNRSTLSSLPEDAPAYGRKYPSRSALRCVSTAWNRRGSHATVRRCGSEHGDNAQLYVGETPQESLHETSGENRSESIIRLFRPDNRQWSRIRRVSWALRSAGVAVAFSQEASSCTLTNVAVVSARCAPLVSKHIRVGLSHGDLTGALDTFRSARRIVRGTRENVCSITAPRGSTGQPDGSA